MSSSLVTNRDYLINLNSGANTLSILGTVAITGNLSVSGNATLSGNILGDRIQNGTTSIDIQTINGNANVTVGGVSNVAVLATTGAYVAGVVSATGNISGNYFVGNGSQLTGVAGTYGNANVVANLAALGSNPVSTTGNITAGNLDAINLVINNISSDDSTFVTIEDGLNVTSGFISAPESMSLTAGSATWTLGTNDTLTLPGGSKLRPVGANLDLVAGTGAYVNLITSDGNSYVGVDNGGGYIATAGGTWNFSTTGNLTAPGAISAAGNITGGNVSTAALTSTASLSITGNTATITSANYSVGYLNIPQVAFTGNATIAATDAGKHYYSTLSTANVLTIANNTSVSWAVGTAISLVNRGTGNITVAQGSGVSLYLAGNATAGNRTVTTYGMATLLNVAANVWMINGTGVS